VAAGGGREREVLAGQRASSRREALRPLSQLASRASLPLSGRGQRATVTPAATETAAGSGT
jgi:hypothetical protein